MESARPLLRIIADEIEFEIKDSVPPESTVLPRDKPDIYHFDIAIRKCLHEICKTFNEPGRILLKVAANLLENIRLEDVAVHDLVTSNLPVVFVFSCASKKIKTKLNVVDS